eukprot:10835906-Lingulodinium_polyedra.AAC.1
MFCMTRKTGRNARSVHRYPKKGHTFLKRLGPACPTAPPSWTNQARGARHRRWPAREDDAWRN